MLTCTPPLWPGTIRNYMKMVADKYRGPAFRSALKACSLAYADADSKHAADIAEHRVGQLITEAPAPIARILWFMTATGGRIADLQRLRRSQIVIDMSSPFSGD